MSPQLSAAVLLPVGHSPAMARRGSQVRAGQDACACGRRTRPRRADRCCALDTPGRGILADSCRETGQPGPPRSLPPCAIARPTCLGNGADHRCRCAAQRVPWLAPRGPRRASRCRRREPGRGSSPRPCPTRRAGECPGRGSVGKGVAGRATHIAVPVLWARAVARPPRDDCERRVFRTYFRVVKAARQRSSTQRVKRSRTGRLGCVERAEKSNARPLQVAGRCLRLGQPRLARPGTGHGGLELAANPACGARRLRGHVEPMLNENCSEDRQTPFHESVGEEVSHSAVCRGTRDGGAGTNTNRHAVLRKEASSSEWKPEGKALVDDGEAPREKLSRGKSHGCEQHAGNGCVDRGAHENDQRDNEQDRWHHPHESALA
jgi:hypothetical protein